MGSFLFQKIWDLNRLLINQCSIMYNEKVEVKFMNENYVVSEEYLAQRGLDLNEYALDGTYIPAITQLAIDLLVTRISYLDDTTQGESAIESYLDKNADKVETFFKAQYRVIYNLIFQAETSPTDSFVDNIIVHELGLGKINGWQKGIYYRHDR